MGRSPPLPSALERNLSGVATLSSAADCSQFWQKKRLLSTSKREGGDKSLSRTTTRFLGHSPLIFTWKFPFFMLPYWRSEPRCPSLYSPSTSEQRSELIEAVWNPFGGKFDSQRAEAAEIVTRRKQHSKTFASAKAAASALHCIGSSSSCEASGS